MNRHKIFVATTVLGGVCGGIVGNYFGYIVGFITGGVITLIMFLLAALYFKVDVSTISYQRPKVDIIIGLTMTIISISLFVVRGKPSLLFPATVFGLVTIISIWKNLRS
ncbi:hypothetical protein [Geomonas ferrireducens]|uniref:hypothetical protein n=1 Tax=Geomonas ferrireducens TaxID=2570227 RepID=UPI0010A79472|nr:hypothetical protein [Geomonas ferrireducens]